MHSQQIPCAPLLLNLPHLRNLLLKMDSPVSFSSHVAHDGLVVRSRYRGRRFPGSKTNSTSTEDPPCMGLLHAKSYVVVKRPILVSEVWRGDAVAQYLSLRALKQHRIDSKESSHCLRQRKVIHNDLKTDLVLNYMKTISKTVFEKLPHICNELHQLPPYDPTAESPRKRPRTVLDCTFENAPKVKRRQDISTLDH
ncbi:hypothetical protein AVEN_211849-1 [Araneus ventricosus]|uniref:Uncharacterized protein n=1 Tax=Araneus ventricosus TaxID=182803 RepID=A0A4Y2IL39_ARAVE|nr:hypothetical protein AVEN_211849-1 [Araneus ventricosus]